MRALFVTISLLICGPILAKPVATPLDWDYEGTNFSGYVIYDDESDALRPGLAMVPNWMTAVNAVPGSSHPARAGTTRR